MLARITKQTFISLIITAFLLTLLTSCGQLGVPAVSPSALPEPTVTEGSNINTDDPGESKIIIRKKDGDLYDIHDGEREYKNYQILYSCESLSGQSGPIKSAEIYGYEFVAEYEPLLIVHINNNDTPLLFHLAMCYTYYPLVYLQDIDGDGADEIIVESVIRATSIGEFVLHVLKVIDNELVELYRFPTYDYVKDGIQYEVCNFGFKGKLLDHYKLLFEFPSLNFSKIIDYSDNGRVNIKQYYNGKGKPLDETEDPLLFQCFQRIDVEDMDGDGIYEIIGRQNIRITGHRGIGTAIITLKYNVENQKMEVINVDVEEWK